MSVVSVRSPLTWLSFAVCLFRAAALPVVDPGLFVISGVMTCGGGNGYCLLGLDCTLDADFLPDPQGHCEGLKNAFTPSAYFSCCKANDMRPTGPWTHPTTTDGPKTPKPTPTNASYTQINSTPVSTTPLALNVNATEFTNPPESTHTAANTQTTSLPTTESPGAPATRQGDDITEMTSDATEQSTFEGEFSYPPLRENSIDMEDREGSGSRKTGGMSEGTTTKVTISMHEPDLTTSPRTDVPEETYVDDDVDGQGPEEMPEEQDTLLFDQDEEQENEEGEEEDEQEEDLFHREEPARRPEVNEIEKEILKVRPDMSEVRPGVSKGQEILRIHGPNDIWPEMVRPSTGMTEYHPVQTQVHPQAGARPMVQKDQTRPETPEKEMLPVVTQSPPKTTHIRPLITENRVSNDSEINIVRIRPTMTEVRPETDDSEVYGTRIDLPKKDLVEADLIDEYAEENEYEMDLVSPERPSMIEIPYSTQGPKETSTHSTTNLISGHKTRIGYPMEHPMEHPIIGHPMEHPIIGHPNGDPMHQQDLQRYPVKSKIGHPMGGHPSGNPIHQQDMQKYPINGPESGIVYPMIHSTGGHPTGDLIHQQDMHKYPLNGHESGEGYPIGHPMGGHPTGDPTHQQDSQRYPIVNGSSHRPVESPVYHESLDRPHSVNPMGGHMSLTGDSHLDGGGYPTVKGQPEAPDYHELTPDHERPMATMVPGHSSTSETPPESSTEDLAVSKTYLNYIRDKINTTIAEISTSLNNRFPGLRPGIISNTISDVVTATQRPFVQAQSPVLGDGSGELFNRDNASAGAFARPRNCDMVRDVEWRFQEDGQTMCYGILIDAVRILTSASCVLKLFESNMAGVSAISNRGNNHSINGVTVHENFQAVSNPQAMNKNDLGIVTLKATVPYNDQCIPKLPFKGQILRNMKCSSTHNEEESEYKTKPMFSRYSSNYVNRDSPLCSHSLSTFEVNRTPYLTLACQNAVTADTRKISQDTSGSGVMCDGILAGIELSSGLGAKAYTPLSMYVDWINKNIKGPSISQRFRVGYYNFKK
nr:PREDICTED: uncharacterized protein LOC109032420 [Bemisia tabaci]